MIRTVTPDMIQGGLDLRLKEGDKDIDEECLANFDTLIRSYVGLTMANKGSRIVHQTAQQFFAVRVGPLRLPNSKLSSLPILLRCSYRTYEDTPSINSH